MVRPIIYKDDVKRLLADGVSPQKISEILGCALSTVTYYRECKAWRPNKEAPEGFHWCSRCQEYHPIEMFNTDSSQSDGLQHICKECNKKMAKRFREKQKLKGK